MQYIRRGFGPDAVEYTEAWTEQQRLHSERVADERDDAVLLLEHPAVYTAGKRTEPWERPTDGTPVVDVDRGGKITWHGPGQLVGYPIVRLAEPIDVLAFVRRLEDALIAVCADVGVHAVRIEEKGYSGVWVPADDRGPRRKLAAIGLRVACGVTMHGFALNCDCTLDAYDAIIPCGLTDVGTTSLSRELGRTVSVPEILPITEARLEEYLPELTAAGRHDAPPQNATAGAIAG